MLTYIDGSGNLVKTIPEKVFQGSNYANTFYFIGAYPQASVVEIAFKLPQTGHYTPPYLMLNANIPTELGLNAWSFDVPLAITEYYGKIEFQVRVRGGQKTIFVSGVETTVSETIASAYGTFEVEKGVPVVLPDTPSQTIYDQILDLISQIQARINNHELVGMGILPWSNAFNYPIDTLIYYGDNLYQCINVDGNGDCIDQNPEEETYYWKKWDLDAITDLLSRVKTLETTVGGFDGRITQAENDASEAKSIANDAKTIANSKQDTLTTAQLEAVNSGITAEKIMSSPTTTSENPLVNREFVNSSIATNTANFIGTFATVSALESYEGTITDNDYAFVVNSERDFATTTEMNAYDKTLLTNFDYGWIPNNTKYDLYRFDIVTQTWDLRVEHTAKADVTLNTAYNRYKYNASTEEWAWEYTLNNSSFTASQWAAINSGITSDLVALIGSYAFKSLTPPSSTNLTRDEADTIVGGAVINGSFTIGGTTFSKLVFMPAETGTNVFGLAVYSSGSESGILNYRISDFSTTPVLSISTYNYLTLKNIGNINGKAIPAYPNDDTKTYALLQVNGVLTWVENGGTYVTLDTAQTITGLKSFDNKIDVINTTAQTQHTLEIENEGIRALVKMNNTELMRFVGQYGTSVSVGFNPLTSNTVDLGKNGNEWKDLYLKGKVIVDTYKILKDSFGQLEISNANTISMQFDGDTIRAKNLVPIGDNSRDLGSSSTYWKDLYLAGKAKFKNTNASGSATWQLEEDQYGQFTLSRTYNNVETKMFEFNGNSIKPVGSNGNLGATTQRWTDLFLSGIIDFGDNAKIIKDSSNRVVIQFGGNDKVKVGSTDTLFSNRVTADSNNTYDLGRSGVNWRNLYLSGNINNGLRAVSVGDITAIQSLADEYDNTATYAVGDIVSYGGLLYICSTAVTTAEDFDDTKWTETNMASYVQSLINSSITTALNTPV